MYLFDLGFCKVLRCTQKSYTYWPDKYLCLNLLVWRNEGIEQTAQHLSRSWTFLISFVGLKVISDVKCPLNHTASHMPTPWIKPKQVRPRGHSFNHWYSRSVITLLFALLRQIELLLLPQHSAPPRTRGHTCTWEIKIKKKKNHRCIQLLDDKSSYLNIQLLYPLGHVPLKLI